MKTRVHMQSQSQGIEFNDVTNTYTKDGLFCVYLAEENLVYKYPLCNIFSIKEEYQ